MKKSIILLVIAVVLVAGAIVYLNKQKTTPSPTLVADAAPTQSEPKPQEMISVPKPETVTAVVSTNPTPAPVALAAPAVVENDANDATNSIRKTVDALLSAKNGLEKHNLFQQLSKDQLEGVIAELKQRSAANPKDAEIPTTLGEAQLNLVRQLHESGTDEDQVGILAMQADQSFNAALKIDPKNWEAQYVKASTMFYWPPNEARDNQAAQMLASLIDQQDTMAAQPQFPLTYAALIKQYQKMGKQDEAAATLKLALQKFPADPALRQLAMGQ